MLVLNVSVINNYCYSKIVYIPLLQVIFILHKLFI